MANYQYGKDILEDVLFRAGEAAVGGGSDYETPAKRYIHRVYLDFLKLHPWHYATKYPPGVFSTEARLDKTAAVTNLSTTVTLSATHATSLANFWLMDPIQGVPYRIASHTAGSANVVLDATYKEVTNAALSVYIFKDEYGLASDCLVAWRLLDRSSPEDSIEIEGIGTMHRGWPDRGMSVESTAAIEKAAYVADNIIRIAPYTVNAETVEYSYTPRPTVLDFTGAGAGDTPIVAEQDRHILADWALHFVFKDKKMTTDARDALAMAMAGADLAWSVDASKLKSRLVPTRGGMGTRRVCHR
ncbi:MAG: hypothetical protein ACYTAF_15440 [Planctomycetota bacterium]|jgi:hypothetical protein